MPAQHILLFLLAAITNLFLLVFGGVDIVNVSERLESVRKDSPKSALGELSPVNTSKIIVRKAMSLGDAKFKLYRLPKGSAPSDLMENHLLGTGADYLSTTVNASTSSATIEKLIQLTGDPLRFPILECNGLFIVGYSPDLLDDYLKKFEVAPKEGDKKKNEGPVEIKIEGKTIIKTEGKPEGGADKTNTEKSGTIEIKKGAETNSPIEIKIEGAPPPPPTKKGGNK